MEDSRKENENETISWNCCSSFAQGAEAWPEAARKGQGQLGAYGMSFGIR